MRQMVGVLSATCAIFLVTACGKGLDASLSTTNEAAYRPSLNKAWKDMTEAQQEAYNWAVSDLNLDVLHARYPDATPRTIISKEADAVIKQQAGVAAQIASDLAENLPRIEKEEAALRIATEELDKIVVTQSFIRKSNFGFQTREVAYTTKNSGNIDVSTTYWNALVFVNGEERSDRKCRIFANYKYSGGLASDRVMNMTYSIGGFACNDWDTLEVKNAKTLSFRFDLDKESAKNFAEKHVLPALTSPTRSDFEYRVKQSKLLVETALKAKASLL